MEAENLSYISVSALQTTLLEILGNAGVQLVEALHYKPECRGFDARWCHWKFYWHNPSRRAMALGLTEPITEMSTRNISWGQRRPVRTADNLTTFICGVSWNLGTSTSWKPQGLSRPVMGLFSFTSKSRKLQILGLLLAFHCTIELIFVIEILLLYWVHGRMFGYRSNNL